MTDPWDGEPGWEELAPAEAWRWGLISHVNRLIAPIGLQLYVKVDPDGGTDVLTFLASKPFRPIAVHDDETAEDRLLNMRALQWISNRLSPFIEHLISQDERFSKESLLEDVPLEAGDDDVIDLDIEPPKEGKTWLN